MLTFSRKLFSLLFRRATSLALPQEVTFYNGVTAGSRLTQSGPLLMTSLLRGPFLGQWNSISADWSIIMIIINCVFFFFSLHSQLLGVCFVSSAAKTLMCWKAGSCLPELIEIMWMPFVLNPSGCAIKRRESAAPEERWEDLRGFTLVRFVCWERERERVRESVRQLTAKPKYVS